MTTTLAVFEALAEVVRERAQRLGIPVRLVSLAEDGVPLADASGTEVVLRAGSLHGEGLRRFLRATPSVRWVHVVSAGVDRVLVPEILESEIVVTRTRGVHDRPVAEFAMSLMLLTAKRLNRFWEAQARREWLDLQPAQLANATLAIVGYGEIGRALARRAKGFEMRVLGVRRHPEPDEWADEVVGLDRMHDVLCQADYVVLAAPATKESLHLIGAAEIKAMPRHAFLINVGRGSLVDEEALDALLRAGELAGALLDTVSREPLHRDHPLWSNPKVVLTPHVAGLRQVGLGGPSLDQFLENVRRYSRGEPLLNQVDKQVGY